MDLLPLPQDPTFPTPETPYLTSENWDLGPFTTFLDRTYQDLGLNESPRLPVEHALLSLPVQKIFDSIPADRLQSFLQTWLYFGLIAEFLSLNETAEGVRLVSLEQAREEMAALYSELSKESESGRVLTSVAILSKRELLSERIKLFPDLSARYHYLHKCLTRAVQIINNSFNQLDHCIRYSLSGLGELFMTGIYTSSNFTNPRITMPAAGFNWYRDYLRQGNDVEKQMVGFGWCPSEIEKIRNIFQGVASLHYVSRLRPRTLPSDHVNCSSYACRAFQIDLSQYKPRHATEGCQCDDVAIDDTELSRILRTTDSFPVLRIDGAADAALPVQVTMETYEPGTEYVALSHVWADGLGNPRTNALPSCQLAKVANSVAQLGRDNGIDELQASYRVWIDTLCCPVELEGKAIALKRITDVYANATHVLVMDSSLICLNTTTCENAELLLRTFSCSPWMRRLWTLQEAILAKSLCIQFEDRAASTEILMRDLYLAGMKDMRRLRIWHDLLNEFNLIQNFRLVGRTLEDTFDHPEIIILQRALHFRTVSVESDEPLCIATLMSLQIEGLTLMTDGQGRMARVWGALAKVLGGLSSQVVFYLEETLSIEGWRWAPKSLLGSMGKDSMMGIDERSLRFSVPKPKTLYSVGIPTPKGFRMQSKGGFLTVAPIRGNFDLHPWKGVTKKTIEAYVLLYREATGEWYRAADWHRSRKLGVWTNDEVEGYDKQNPSPLFDAIRTNNAALIFHNLNADAEVNVAILGQVKPVDDDDPDAVLFRRERTVMCWRMREMELKLLHKVIPIANRFADDKVTADLVKCGKEESPARVECIAKARAYVEAAVAEECKTDPEFVELIRNVLGKDMQDSAWPLVLVDHSNVITLKDSPDDQVWIVD